MPIINNVSEGLTPMLRRPQISTLIEGKLKEIRYVYGEMSEELNFWTVILKHRLTTLWRISLLVQFFTVEMQFFCKWISPKFDLVFDCKLLVFRCKYFASNNTILYIYATYFKINAKFLYQHSKWLLTQVLCFVLCFNANILH